MFDQFAVNLSGERVPTLRDLEESSLTGGRQTECEAAGRKNNQNLKLRSLLLIYYSEAEVDSQIMPREEKVAVKAAFS